MSHSQNEATSQGRGLFCPRLPKKIRVGNVSGHFPTQAPGRGLQAVLSLVSQQWGIPGSYRHKGLTQPHPGLADNSHGGFCFIPLGSGTPRSSAQSSLSQICAAFLFKVFSCVSYHLIELPAPVGTPCCAEEIKPVSLLGACPRTVVWCVVQHRPALRSLSPKASKVVTPSMGR